MTALPISQDVVAAPAGRPASAAAWGRPLLSGATVVIACLLATLGPAAAWAAALVGAACCAALARSPGRADGAAEPAGAGDARLMIESVVPVWKRQLEATKSAAESGFTHILETFSRVSDGLSRVAQSADLSDAASASSGDVDHLLQKRPEAVERLLVPMQRALAQREAARAMLEAGDDTLAALLRLAQQQRADARHLRMVATNASIEANRSKTAGSGDARCRFDAVAAEIRALASSAGTLAEQTLQGLGALQQQLKPLRRDAVLNDAGIDELMLETRLQARAVLVELLTELGASLQASRELRTLSHGLRDDLDQVFVGFQSGDRVSQMLDILGRDLARLAAWNATGQPATRADAAQWLAELERSYTMDEQRSQHHGTTAIQRDAGVEFF